MPKTLNNQTVWQKLLLIIPSSRCPTYASPVARISTDHGTSALVRAHQWRIMLMPFERRAFEENFFAFQPQTLNRSGGTRHMIVKDKFGTIKNSNNDPFLSHKSALLEVLDLWLRQPHGTCRRCVSFRPGNLTAQSIPKRNKCSLNKLKKFKLCCLQMISMKAC